MKKKKRRIKKKKKDDFNSCLKKIYTEEKNSYRNRAFLELVHLYFLVYQKILTFFLSVKQKIAKIVINPDLLSSDKLQNILL